MAAKYYTHFLTAGAANQCRAKTESDVVRLAKGYPLPSDIFLRLFWGQMDVTIVTNRLCKGMQKIRRAMPRTAHR